MVVQITPRVNRTLEDRNYGREEYMDDCVQRIIQGEKVFISTGGVVSSTNLPPIIREKYSAFFPGFEDALDEVKAIVAHRLGSSSKLTTSELREDSDSYIFYGTPNLLMGYYVWLNEGKAKLD